MSGILGLLMLGLAAPHSSAQSVSVTASPTYLTFGIPTGTSPAVSSPQTVTVNITGSGSVTFSAATATAPFSVSGSSCQSTLTAPTSCQVSVILGTSSTTLQTGTLTIPYTSGDSNGSLSVSLSGAYGAIELFGETNIALSVSWASFTDLYTIASSGQNLSCPANPTATISNTPDGLGYAFVDNYLTLSINGTLVNAGSSNPPGNVCTGGQSDSNNGVPYPDCFSTNYQIPASSLYGDNPDTFVNPGNTVLSIQPPNTNNAGGVPPLNVSSFFSGDGTPPYPVQASFAALDQGSLYGTSTLFLVTNCSPAGIVPGGTITGNPIATNPTQTYTFDSNPNQDISFQNSVAQSTATFNPGTTPSVTDIGVPQQLFYQLVQNTSAAPAVCFRLSSELDSFGNPMCKGFLIQCYNPANGTTSGQNCDPTTVNEVRDLYYSMQFASPDGPVNGSNYLYGPVGSPAADACSNVVPGGSCATGTGPGVLLGGDNWACAASGSPCPAVANTQTPTSPPTYSQSNCVLTGYLAGALCPLDILTQFFGAADGKPGSTVGSSNSVMVPVVNAPLPTQVAAVAGQNSYGWIRGSSAINATFTSNAATYPTTGNIPPANGFTAASPFTLTYGISTWPNLPDTTYPVPGDVTNSNASTSPTTPFCNINGPATTPPSFVSNGSETGLSDGMYNLHYFTTDCAFAEGLVFNPTGSQLTNPAANWASFPFTTVGIDNVAPQVSSCSTPPAPVYNGWYNANFSQSCTVTDTYSAGNYGSGFLPLVANSIQGSPSEAVTVSTSAPVNAVSVGVFAVPAPATPTPGCDLAGNCVTVQTGPYNFDLQPPTITGPTFSYPGPYFVGGPPVTVTFTCSDGAGSGVASCTGSGPASSGGTLNTSTPGTYTFTVTAIDNVGNQSTSSAMYTVENTNSAVTLTSTPNPSVSGKPVTFTATVSSSSGKPTGLVVFLIPNGTAPLGSAFLKSGVAVFKTSALPAGSDPIVAVYGGDATHGGSSSPVLNQVVQAPTTTSLTSSPNPSTFGQTVLFTATVTSSIGPPPNGEVTFLEGTTVLGTGTVSEGTATFSTSTLSVGKKSIKAEYGGDTYFTSSKSAALGQVVNKSNP